ncbi:MAG: hypothetical protein F6K17_20635, partial [Okeania sp. SIO3C4]|nr:hypothetical protein [Okeania sp. SIO3C4]
YIVERVYFSDGDYGPPPEVTEQRAKLKKKQLQKKKSKQRKPKIKGKRK